jgi:hypothetical protein
MLRGRGLTDDVKRIALLPTALPALLDPVALTPFLALTYSFSSCSFSSSYWRSHDCWR